MSALLLTLLDGGPADPTHEPAELAELRGQAHAAVASTPDPLGDDDLQLSLTVCYELHYRGLEGVDERWEWHPGLLGVRAELETAFERALRAEVSAPDPTDRIDRDLKAMITAADTAGGPSLSSYLRRHATAEQFREFVMHRSVYQLKEADPHTWALPRLTGTAKSALVEIQADEYGNGRPGRAHAELFARMMRALDLDDTEGAYLDTAPAAMLALVNTMSLFGLHRRWRGALAGHLAAYEMTSSTPCRKYGEGLRRLGFDSSDATWFYDEHVEADAVHEQLAAVDLCGGLVAAEPALAADVLFGAGCDLAMEARFGSHLMTAWQAGRSSLRDTPAAAA